MIRSAAEIMFSLSSTAAISRETGGAERHFFSAGALSVNNGFVPSGHFPQFIIISLLLASASCWLWGAGDLFPNEYMDFSGLYP